MTFAMAGLYDEHGDAVQVCLCFTMTASDRH